VAVERDHQQHRVGKPQGLGVDAHGIALDHTLVLHALDACPAGRGAEPHRLADVLQAGTRIALQYSKDFPVNFVHAANFAANSSNAVFFPENIRIS